MSDSNWRFDYAWKGNSGEFIIERLLKKLGFKVFRFGMEERALCNLEEDWGLMVSDVGNRIINAPDFIVIGKETGGEGHIFKGKRLLAIEVKLRSNLSSHEKEVKKLAEKYARFSPETILVFVTNDETCPFQACRVGEYKDLTSLVDFIDLLGIGRNEKNTNVIEAMKKTANYICSMHDKFYQYYDNEIKLYNEEGEMII